MKMDSREQRRKAGNASSNRGMKEQLIVGDDQGEGKPKTGRHVT